jgi:hypothetical protein
MNFLMQSRRWKKSFSSKTYQWYSFTNFACFLSFLFPEIKYKNNNNKKSYYYISIFFSLIFYVDRPKLPVSFIGGGNRRKPLTCSKPLTNFSTYLEKTTHLSQVTDKLYVIKFFQWLATGVLFSTDLSPLLSLFYLLYMDLLPLHHFRCNTTKSGNQSKGCMIKYTVVVSFISILC